VALVTATTSSSFDPSLKLAATEAVDGGAAMRLECPSSAESDTGAPVTMTADDLSVSSSLSRSTAVRKAAQPDTSVRYDTT